MLATLLALPLAFAVPADTPTEPIDAELMQAFIDIGGTDEMCPVYGEVMIAIDGLNLPPEAEAVFIDAADAYLVMSFEGDSLRLTPEARDVLTGWLHLECA